MHRLAVPSAVLAALLALSLPAGAGAEGLVARTTLGPVAASGESAASGTVEAWLRVRGDGSVLQSFRVTFRGLSDGEGATLWMAKPGAIDLEEVGEFAVSGGTGRFQVGAGGTGVAGDLPLGVARVLDLLRAPVEVRVPGGDLEDEAVLSGEVGVFRFRPLYSSGDGVRGRRARLLRPPPPTVPPDESARGFVRLWVQRRVTPAGPEEEQGISIYARDLTEDATYEVWMEDAAGDLQDVGEMVTTADGNGLFVVDTREGDTLPPEVDTADVRVLFGRRVELRRSGDPDYALVGLCPRVR